MKVNHQLNSMSDSMMTPWKPIGPVLLGKSGAVRRALPRTGPATDYSMMYSSHREHGVESWSRRMVDLIVAAVTRLDHLGIQPTARQVSKIFGVSDGVAKPLLRLAVEHGDLTVGPEWIEQAKGTFTVYRVPAVRVTP